jgi:hypothetical protein
MTRHVSLIAQIVLSLVFIVGYLWLVKEFMSGEARVAADMKDVFIALVGVITGSVVTIVNFWFSSSRSSQAKDEQ